jgi:hypothetical protein
LPPVKELVRVAILPVVYRTQWIPGDGNCMFAAFAKALGRARVTYKTVRREAVAWARRNKGIIKGFISDEDMGHVGATTLAGYLREMGKDGKWGDDAMLYALCGAYGVRVAVLKNVGGGKHAWQATWGEGDENTPTLPLYLANEHYENVLRMREVYGI